MAQRKLKLMISSRCKTKFPLGDPAGVELSVIRKQLKKEIEEENFFGKPLIEVWINEEETGEGTQTSWEACIGQAEKCDLFVCLYDGEAGWQKDGSGIGICQAEFETAHGRSPRKVRAVSLRNDDEKQLAKPGPDLDFAVSIQRANLLDARNLKDAAALKERVKEVVRELLLQLSHDGAREAKKSGANTGQALDWSRMNFTERQQIMTTTLVKSLAKKKKAAELRDGVVVPIRGKKVFFLPTAVPAAFSVSAAREMVGQPFLTDHKYSGDLGKAIGGPVHVVACHKGITETQAMSLLGFPDATIVSGAFGIYVADKIQKIQLCLIGNCLDAASTKHGLQKLFEWLEQTEEDKLLAKRAMSRSKILTAIAGELD